MSLTDPRHASRRPPKFYFYGDRQTIERALHSGEFRLRPTSQGEPITTLPEFRQILPFGARKALSGAGFLTLSLSTALNEKLFQHAPATSACCIVIHNTEDFGERLHGAVRMALPQWAGIDASVAYGAPSPLGSTFTKSRHLSPQKEWLFAWRPIQPTVSLNAVVVQIGSIEEFAELREQSSPGPT